MSLTQQQVKTKMRSLGLKSNIDTKFKKNNKFTYMKPNTEKIDKNGYIKIKVKKSNKYPSGWAYKHIYLWENTYGNIPNNYKLIFLDNNKNNVTLDNLSLVSKEILNILNKKNLIFNSKEKTKLALQYAKLCLTLKKIKKNRR